jgi:hypothetical protein
MNLSPHFTLAEATLSQLAVRKHLINVPSSDVLENMRQAARQMEKVRALLGVPIYVNSWFRSEDLNAAVGGAAGSAHTLGWAIDFTATAFGPPKMVCEAIAQTDIGFDQLIFEGTWVHISFAPTGRSQILTAHFGPGRTTYTSGLPV